MVYFGKFSSGPTNKPQQWDLSILKNAILGRSHRSTPAMERINYMQNLIRDFLLIPESYHVGFAPASATGAMEMALWNLITENGVNIISYDVFGKIWEKDITEQLKIKNTNILEYEYGNAPSFDEISKFDFSKDTVFVGTATTTSVAINDYSWIPDTRNGLTFMDASASMFSEIYEWSKFDVVISPFQKVLGCEANLGLIILSPNAFKRLESYTPNWPIPRILRLKNNGKVNTDFFKGATINTPSMLLIEEIIKTLEFYKNKGGIEYIHQTCRANHKLVSSFIQQSKYFDFLCKEKENRAIVTSCIILKNENTWERLEKITNYLETIGISDILSHKLSAPSIRIWHGPNITKDSLEKLFSLLNNAYEYLFKY